MMQCPICQSTEFKDFNTRKNARCVKCLSVERTRLMWMVLESLNIIKPDMRILHFAPEYPLIKKFRSVSGDLYHPCDLDPQRYKSHYSKVYQMNMCEDLRKMPSNVFDVIIHNHVMEHICCSVKETLIELERITRKGGHHLFSVPFRGSITREDISPQLSNEERKKLFGQSDHVRLFGREDFPAMLKEIWQTSEVILPISKLYSQKELEDASIPTSVVNKIDGNTIFHHIKV